MENLKNILKTINDKIDEHKTYFTLFYIVWFIIIIILFILLFSETKNLRQILNAYSVFTIIFAISSFISIAMDLASSNGAINYMYILSFLINAILGMISLFIFGKMALFIILVVFFLFTLIFIVFLTKEKASDDLTDNGFEKINKNDNVNTFLNFCKINVNSGLFDITKITDIWKYCEADASSNFFGKGFWFIVQFLWSLVFIPLMLVIWTGNGIFQLINYLLGLISPKQPDTTASLATTRVINPQKSEIIHWLGILCIFISVILILFSSQSAMRKNPIATFGIGMVAAIAYLGYVRFNDSGSFGNTFVGVISALFILYLYLYNPYNVFDKMSGINLFFIFLIFFGILGMIYMVHSDIKPGDEAKPNEKAAPPTGTINKLKDMFSKNYKNLLKGFFGLVISIAFIAFLVASIGSMQSSDNNPTAGIYILNTLIVVGMLTIMFNVIDAKYKIRDNATFKLIFEVILYIPCLLSDLADLLMTEYYKTKYFTLILVVLEIIFIIFYWFMYSRIVNKVYSGGGKVLVNEPVPLSKEKIIGYYRSLSGKSFTTEEEEEIKIEKEKTSKYGGIVKRVNTYKFGISCWIYLNPMPSYGDVPLTILDYGNNPKVSYSPQKNELTVNVVNKNESCSETISVYTNKNPPIQKWFNLILNYDGGHLDIFLDSVLVQTSTEVISCVNYDALKIGDKNGYLNAKLCNLIYFNTPLDILTVHNMYNITKIQDTPDVPKRDLFSI